MTAYLMILPLLRDVVALPATGLVLELASPIFPSLFLVLACLGSIARAITGEAYSPKPCKMVLMQCTHPQEVLNMQKHHYCTCCTFAVNVLQHGPESLRQL